MVDIHSISTQCTRTEFVGTAVLDTIGLVISGIDETLLEKMNIGKKYRVLGLISSRTGAAGQLTAMDDAVKATNTELLSFDLPRDTKGWGGHGNYIVIGGKNMDHTKELSELLTQRLGYPPVDTVFRVGGAIAANSGPDIIAAAFKAKK